MLQLRLKETIIISNVKNKTRETERHFVRGKALVIRGFEHSKHKSIYTVMKFWTNLAKLDN